jgi:hypothetical protein
MHRSTHVAVITIKLGTIDSWTDGVARIFLLGIEIIAMSNIASCIREKRSLLHPNEPTSTADRGCRLWRLLQFLVLVPERPRLHTDVRKLVQMMSVGDDIFLDPSIKMENDFAHGHRAKVHGRWVCGTPTANELRARDNLARYIIVLCIMYYVLCIWAFDAKN